MAPKLPPPANTKAVFVGPAWFATDKASVAPALDALVKDHATFGGIYSSRRSRRAIDKSWFNGEDDPCPDAASRRKITGASRMGSAEPRSRSRDEATSGITASGITTRRRKSPK